MRLEYTLTPDDLAEAARPVLPDGRPVAPRPRRDRVAEWVLLVMVTAAGVSIVVHLATDHTPPGPLDPVPPPQNLWVTLLPNLAPTAIFGIPIGWSVLRQATQVRRVTAAVAAGRAVPPPPDGFSLVAIVLWVAVGLAAMLSLWSRPPLAVTWHPTPAAAMVVGFAPWIVGLGVLVAVWSAAGPSAAARLWAAAPALHRPWSADVSDAGVATSDGACDALYRWPYVTGYRETDGLLVLTLEDARLLLLPKRAVPDPADQQALRALLQTHVAAGAFLPRAEAFPVRPVAAG